MSKTHTVQSTGKNFDLPGYLQGLPSLYLRMNVLSSHAWRIDTLITQQCRALFKLLKLTPLALTLDGDAELRAAVSEGAWTEQLFSEAGPDRQAPMQTLWVLAAMRLQAHQDAADATMLVPWSNGSPRQYSVPEIEALFVPTGSTEPKGESLLRMQMSAERNAAKLATGGDVKALAKRFMETRLRMERANMASMQHNMAKQTDSLIALYSYTMAQFPDNIVGDFNELHTDVQRVLIDSSINAAERTVERSESNVKELSFDDHCHMAVVADKLKDDLKAVLASPKFTQGVGTITTRDTRPAAKPMVLKPEAVVHKPVSSLDQAKAEAKAKKPRKAKVVKQEDLAKELSLADQPNDF